MAAAERAGLYYTCVNSYLTADEVAYIVDDCDARVFITTAAKLDLALEAATKTPKVEVFLAIGVDSEAGSFRPYDAETSRYPAEPISDEQLGAAMLYSSGTTGQPEGHPASAPRRSSRRAATGDAVRDLAVRLPSRHDLPVAGPHLPLRAAGLGGCGASSRRHVGDHGALRSGAVPAHSCTSTGSPTASSCRRCSAGC